MLKEREETMIYVESRLRYSCDCLAAQVCNPGAVSSFYFIHSTIYFSFLFFFKKNNSVPLLSLLSSALSSCGGPHLHIWYFEWFDSFFFFFFWKLWMRKKWMAGADRRPKLMNWNVKWLPWSMIFVFVFPTNFSCFGRHFWLLTDCFSTHMVTAKDLQLLPPRTSRCLFLFIFFF